MVSGSRLWLSSRPRRASGSEKAPFISLYTMPLIASRFIAVAVGALGRCQVMALAAEGLFGQQWVEGGVEVHLGEVEQVLADVAGHREVGAVFAGHGVDEGCHAHLDHLEERLANRKAPGAGQHAVFENVGHAGVVRRRCRKAYREQVLRVGGVQVQQPRAAGGVLQQIGDGAHLRYGRGALQAKPVQLGAGIEGDGWCL